MVMSLTAQPFNRLGARHSSGAWEGPGAPHSFRGCFPTVPPSWAQQSLGGILQKAPLVPIPAVLHLCLLAVYDRNLSQPLT